MKTMKYIFAAVFALCSAVAFAGVDASGSLLQIDPSAELLRDPAVSVVTSQAGVVAAPQTNAPVVSDPAYRYSNSMVERRINISVNPVSAPSVAVGSYSGKSLAASGPRIKVPGGAAGNRLGTGGSFTSHIPEGNRVNPGGHLNFGGNGVGNGGSSSSNNGLGNGNRHPGELTPLGDGLLVLLVLLAGYACISLIRRRSRSSRK